MTDIKVPTFPESVEDGAIATWHKQVGDSFNRDELLVEIETDKVILEVPAPQDGTLTKITAKVGDIVKTQQVIGAFGPLKQSQATAAVKDDVAKTKSTDASTDASKKANASSQNTKGESTPEKSFGVKAGPAARRLASEKGVNLNDVAGQRETKGEMVTKEDVMSWEANDSSTGGASANQTAVERVEKRVPMTRLRQSIANRLVESQQTSASLTTFNEVNMQPVMDLRSKYKDAFAEKHQGARLGFMSFFAKAAVLALAKYPEVNSYLDGSDIVYHNYADIGIAVSSPRGLVVPILRDVQLMGLVDIERQIAAYATKAQAGKLALEELQGGTFTISNGGVFGSLLSTPIINPPQTAILGMHKIQERAMVVKGKLEILPMMHLALTYDHRMIDGKTAVQFLVAIIDFLENPGSILLDL